MIAIEKSTDWLRTNGDKTTAVGAGKRGYVRASLAKRIAPDDPSTPITSDTGCSASISLE